MYKVYTKNNGEKLLVFNESEIKYTYMKWIPSGRQSRFEERTINGYIESFINLGSTSIILGGKLL